MNSHKPKIKYIQYARKSSESDERQVQSIDDQIEITESIKQRNNLTVVETITEAKSAKDPDNRPGFNKMIEMLESGEANGILVWKINRLARNPKESGIIQQLLFEKEIESIRTQSRDFLPKDNAILFSVESSMAAQYSRNLSEDVRRGLKSKLEKGWKPGIAPQGYLNTKTEARGENYIVKDPERFPIIRKAWDLMLTGNYSVPEIRDKMNNEWGYRTRKSGSRGGNPISRSSLYELLKKPFYMGLFEYNGKYYEGKHPKMVTADEYDKVQILLGDKGNTRPNRYEYAYNTDIACKECGGTVSATFKEKVLKSTGEIAEYTYYYCVDAQKKETCPHTRYTNVDKIETQIEEAIDKFTMHPDIKEWAIELLHEENDYDRSEQSKIREQQEKTLAEIEKKLDRLNDMYIKDLIEEDAFKKKKQELRKRKMKLEQKMNETEEEADKWIELTEEAFEFATYARKWFRTGDKKTKRSILKVLGRLNCTLKDDKLALLSREWLRRIEEIYPDIEKEREALELGNIPQDKRRRAEKVALRPMVRGRTDLNRRSSP